MNPEGGDIIVVFESYHPFQLLSINFLSCEYAGFSIFFRSGSIYYMREEYDIEGKIS